MPQGITDSSPGKSAFGGETTAESTRTPPWSMVRRGRSSDPAAAVAETVPVKRAVTRPRVAVATSCVPAGDTDGAPGARMPQASGGPVQTAGAGMAVDV